MPQVENKDLVKERSSDLFPVVGVGASAGGLEAFKRLVQAIPEHSGIAFILVQHMEPTHESMLTDLLQKITRIPVQEITNNVHVEPDRIYIIPSNKLLTANDGRLQLSPRLPKTEKHMPIDVFFASLAEVHQEHAIGVVLSGTATDGTLGLKEIRAHGGVTFAQAPGSAAFPGMPQSAIDSGVVDYILAPEAIPLTLLQWESNFRTSREDKTPDGPQGREETFKELLQILRARKGNDFIHYKQSTIRRRITRRMGLTKRNDLDVYLAYFRDNPAEQDLLYQDLLIPVTSFFRDPKTYELLCDSIFPRMLEARDYRNPLRIWVAGCSTGEEPYSMAMCLYENLGEKAADYKVQVFASDISEPSIAKARTGIYTKREMLGLSEARRQQFFTKVNGGFQVTKFIRDMCVFASHNFLKDPPFARMDMVSCRNVLIYMETFLQKKALTTFHYALKENGYLLLGRSESAAPAADLFTAAGRHEKLFIRKSVTGRFIQPDTARESAFKANTFPARLQPLRDDFKSSADAVLLLNFTPPGVIVNAQMDIVQYRGSTGAWLEPSPGKPSLQLLKMAREGLAFELRSTLHKARETNKPQRKENISFQAPGSQRMVTIEVIPLPDTVDRYYLVLFREVPVMDLTKEDRADSLTDAPDRQENKAALQIGHLKQELTDLRQDIQRVTEDQESANEELQSANEELLSGSEELQSLNEELETSKEEIQSTNEELTTLNQELFDRNEQLNLSRLYAESIVETIREPLMVLDRDMKVRTANRSYYNKFNTSEKDTEGMPFFALSKGQWNIPELHILLENVRSADDRIMDFEIRVSVMGAGERVLLLNACRIFREDNAELLILLAIEDVTEARKREDGLQLFSRELEKKVDERTASLRESNKALKQSNDNLEQFATIASHDLQEPLRKIRTFATILNKRHSIEIAVGAQDLLHKIDKSAERMSVLIQDVLNLSKVLDASLFENTDLNTVLARVLEDFELLIGEKKATIRHEHLPVIAAVPLQMNQLFYNLLGNALKFTRQDTPPVITISSRIMGAQEVIADPALSDKKAYTEIIFRDNGIGFDQQFSKQIFLVFQRLNAREHFEGTGIGLALCQRIVTNHQGQITADSEKEKGTQFRILLPLEQ